MVNVGANKGYNLAEWTQRYTAARTSNAQWHRLMMERADPPCALQCCGVCIVCRRKRIAQAADVQRLPLGLVSGLAVLPIASTSIAVDLKSPDGPRLGIEIDPDHCVVKLFDGGPAARGALGAAL